MDPSLSTSYIIPAIFLNPIILLHGLNTIFSRTLPPIAIAGPIQRPPYSMYGPAAVRQHFDVQSSEILCWGYTIIMICAQLIAYGQISQRRVERKEIPKQTDETAKLGATQGLNGLAKSSEPNKKTFGRTPGQMNTTGKGPQGNRRLETIEEDPRAEPMTENRDSEVVL